MVDSAPSAPKFVAAPNPIDMFADIQNVRSGPVVAPVHIEGEDFNRGMILRHVFIQGDKGVVMSATVSMTDIVFMLNSFAQMVSDDAKLLARFHNFRLLTDTETRKAMLRNLDEVVKMVVEARDQLSNASFGHPEEEKGLASPD